MEKYKILADLVGFNTIKDKENVEILDYIENYLLELNFKTELKNKNLVMSYGENPKIGFLGHTDTVSYTEGWQTNPFELTLKDGKLYGLGVCDMKSGIAAILDAVKDSKIKNGIKLYFTYDEEIGFGGVYNIIKNEENFPEIMIFGEPTNNEILTGSKGILEFEIDFFGVKAHASNPIKGKNANMMAVKLLIELEKFYEDIIKKEENESFEIPYTTMNVGTINGGTDKNSVSDFCKITLDFRAIKKEHNEAIKSKIEELSKKYKCEMKVIECVEPFINKPEFVEEVKTSNFITEASFVDVENRIILGTGPVTAHEMNESITTESYDKLVKQYKELIEKFG